MSRSYWKVVVIAAAVMCIAMTPVVWLLGGVDAGQLVGASAQVLVGVIGLVWAALRPAGSVAVGTGKATATGGGSANSGVRGSGRVERSGDARATGQGSSANTGIS